MNKNLKKYVFAISFSLLATGCSSTSAVTNNEKSSSENSSIDNYDVQEIELNIDNWQDYLEMQELFNKSTYDDETLENWPNAERIFISYVFKLKDGLKLYDNECPTVAIQMEYDNCIYTFTNVDWTNYTFEYGEKVKEVSHNKEVSTINALVDKEAVEDGDGTIVKLAEFSKDTLGTLYPSNQSVFRNIWYYDGYCDDGDVCGLGFPQYGDHITYKVDNLKITNIFGTLHVVKE